jgi:predicted  nucleic acid-binding Zn-ribbon protein
MKSKDAHIALLEREVHSLRELTPMKLREYLVSSTQTFDEYNNSLHKQIEELRGERAAFEQQIRDETKQIVDALIRGTSAIKAIGGKS